MKSVKARALSSLLGLLVGMVGAFALVGCLAEAAPTEPGTAGAEKGPAGAGPGAGGAAGNERAVGTTTTGHPATIIPWQEPLPNPWHPDPGASGTGPLPKVSGGADPAAPTSPSPARRDPVTDPDVERYDGPPGSRPW